MTADTTAALIPAYNEAATIRALVSAVLDRVDRVIVVDDGSSDATIGQLTGLDLTLLRNPGNLGKGAALARGMHHAIAQGFGHLITLDADGQHDPAEIPRLLAASRAHPRHIIIGARLKSRRNAPVMRRFANGFADFWVSWAAGYPIRDSQSGFRLYPLDLLARPELDLDNGQGFTFESKVLIDAAGLKYYSTAIGIDTIYPQARRPSHYRAWADTWSITRMVAGKLWRRGFYPLGLARALGLLSSPIPKAAGGPRPPAS